MIHWRGFSFVATETASTHRLDESLLIARPIYGSPPENQQRKGITEMTDMKYGTARRIIHEELHDIPVGFAEFLLGLHYLERGITQGTVFYVSRHDADEWLRDYFNDFDATYEEVMAAKEWIDAMPEFVGDMLIDISGVALPHKRDKPKDV